jgi:peptidoglycan-N-acetylglucosamine deacetylase
MQDLMTLLVMLIAIIILYTICPYLLSFWLGLGVFRKDRMTAGVAFTFDDGPDPKYTGQFLDLLKKHRIKATFFVVGSKAEKNPELILRMHAEGHLIGIHNYVHRSNWLMMPWTVRRDLARSASIVENITGVRPIYYRPPWGLMNLFDYFFLGKFQIILWSIMVGDWRSKGGSEKIISKIMQRIKPGDVILLHDSGETWGANEDAPYYTIEALKNIFVILQNQGYHFMRIDEMIDKSVRVESNQI